MPKKLSCEMFSPKWNVLLVPTPHSYPSVSSITTLFIKKIFYFYRPPKYLISDYVPWFKFLFLESVLPSLDLTHWY